MKISEPRKLPGKNNNNNIHNIYNNNKKVTSDGFLAHICNPRYLGG
jgi:hypothetical protein